MQFEDILIVGGRGYIGQNLAFQLNSQYNIIAVDSRHILADTSNLRIDDYFRSSSTSTTSPLATKTLFKSTLKTGNLSIQSFDLKMAPFLMIYAAGNEPPSQTKKWMDFAVDMRIPNIFFLSSAAVYGHALYLPQDEKHPRLPINDYGQKKCWGEDYLELLQNRGDVNLGVCFRIFNLYGNMLSNQLVSRTAFQMIDFLCTKIRNKETRDIRISTHSTPDGSFTRDYLHIEDAAFAIEQAIKLIDTFSVYTKINLGTGVATSLLDLVGELGRIFNESFECHSANIKTPEAASSVANIDLAYELLKWRPKIELKAGLLNHFQRFYSPKND